MAKTENYSIRFEPEQLELVKVKENLETPQKVINFLMDKYWWEHKIGNNPILERVEEKQGEQKKEEKSQEVDQSENKIAAKIQELRNEYARLGTSSLARQRKMYLEKEIDKLEKLK